MNHSADETRASLANNLRYFIKWSLIALLIGGTGGLIGSLFSMGVSFATSFRMNHPNMLFFLPVSGILIVWLYHTFHEEGNRGTNMVIDAISSTEKVTLATGPLIFVSTVLTHIAGGSSGREGAALQLGGSLGNLFGNAIHLDEKDKKIAIMCGMSAVLCTFWNTGSSSYLPAGSDQYRCTVLCSPGSLYFFFFYRSGDRQIFRHCRRAFYRAFYSGYQRFQCWLDHFFKCPLRRCQHCILPDAPWCRAHLQENISKSLCAYPGSQCYFYPSYPADRY